MIKIFSSRYYLNLLFKCDDKSSIADYLTSNKRQTFQFNLICASGYTGTTCQTLVSACASNPCASYGGFFSNDTEWWFLFALRLGIRGQFQPWPKKAHRLGP